MTEERRKDHWVSISTFDENEKCIDIVKIRDPHIPDSLKIVEELWNYEDVKALVIEVSK